MSSWLLSQESNIAAHSCCRSFRHLHTTYAKSLVADYPVVSTSLLILIILSSAKVQPCVMRSVIFTAVALVSGYVGSVVAEENIRIVSNDLARRQSGQFVPGTISSPGASCVEAFGEGYEACREKTSSAPRLCYNPSEGHTCCSSEWACPSDSFCLVSPYCCPSGIDASSCAASLGVSAPPKTSTATATATATVTQKPSGSASGTASQNGTSSHPATYSKPAPSKPPTFTGAAVPQTVTDVGFAAVLGGALTYLLALL
ncbi:hypothetical protein P152DRAFT_515926 [Eremomyces bilateralis CBS 781.70]|uniref:Uncharacterized protein n=1 Tax=Eremomyces bilateralis CBS 781.70 TaxID=1392243 RepID=A0A6G1FXH5_9PEZI|nr:uncharacterized protein P152DRAFT_515926 [Eremomyces bilateralis CBS 781.70]KAF1810381.1 hypothetical protein P152DRAFT_515926 [Eremomyces bilateralis CBS 781.70]